MFDFTDCACVGLCFFTWFLAFHFSVMLQFAFFAFHFSRYRPGLGSLWCCFDVCFLTLDGQNSTTIMLLLLGVVERATRYSVGCEAFLGWWPREDDSIPSSISEGYSHLLKLILSKPRHDVASLATYLLHRLRFYEIASRYEVLLP